MTDKKKWKRGGKRVREPSAEELWQHSSFKYALEHICPRLKPRNVLEWGPGPSTMLLARLCPGARILTIEHSDEWADRFEFNLDRSIPEIKSRISLKRLAIGGNGESQGYSTYPLMLNKSLGSTFDLVFVDGRQRADCLTVAYSVMSALGVVVLHDAHRENYLKNADLFHFCRILEKQRTAILSNYPIDRVLEGFEEVGFDDGEGSND